MTVISCCSYWKGQQRHLNAGKKDPVLIIFHFFGFVLDFPDDFCYFKLRVTITHSEDTSLTCQSLIQRAKCGLPLCTASLSLQSTHFYGNYYPPQTTTWSCFGFLLKRELGSLCMKFNCRARFFYLKYLHMKIRLQKGRAHLAGSETQRPEFFSIFNYSILKTPLCQQLKKHF